MTHLKIDILSLAYQKLHTDYKKCPGKRQRLVSLSSLLTSLGAHPCSSKQGKDKKEIIHASDDDTTRKKCHAEGEGDK